MQASLSPRCLSHGGRERACGFGVCGLDLPAVPPSPGPGAVPFAGDSGVRAQSRAVRCPAPRVLAASVGTRVLRGGRATLLSPGCTRGARWSHMPVGRLQEATGLGAPRPGPPPVGALWVLCPSDRVLQAVRRQVSWCVDRHRWPAARADTQTVLSLASQPKPSVGLPHAARRFCRDRHRPQAVRRVRQSAPRDTVSGRGRGRSCLLFTGAARGLDENLAKHVRTFH